MKEIEIDLSQPFEIVLEAVLALPNRSINGAGDDCADENELRQAIRALYEAANGRQVETEIGLIPIAPPIAPFLKAVPFRAATLNDFLVAAAAQIVGLPLHRNGRSPISPIENGHRKQRTKADRRLKKQTIRAQSNTLFHRPKISEFTPQLTAAHHD